MRTRIGVAIAVTAALTLGGCSAGGGGSTESGSAAAVGGDLVMARGADIQSLNKTTIFDNNTIRVIQQMMEPLFMVSPDGATIDPWLATGYEISDDGLTYTITLRDDVTFSNGDPMTAADVKFSIDENTASGAAGWGFVNDAIDTVTATDDTTVTVLLKRPWAPFIADLSIFANGIIPLDYGGKTAEEFYTAPIGTGPFVWDSWTPGQSVKLTKNDQYWQEGKPSLDSVTWTVVADANTRQLQVQGGQIDIDDTPDWSSVEALSSAPGVKVDTYESTQIDYMAFNQLRPPFDDVHVRRALSYAIDRDALVDAVLFGNGDPAYSLLSPGTPYFDEDAGGADYDVDKAKEELAQSSMPDGFTTTILTRSGDANQAAVAQIMQSEFAEIGVTLEITTLDPTAARAARQALDFDMALLAWTMDIPDPDQWTSFAVDPEGGSEAGYTSYNNPDVIALNKRAATETDEDTRRSLYSDLQKQVSEDAFLAYLYYSPYVFATTDEIDGFHVTPLGNYHLEDVTKSE
jgi:peptide/nickel transport system substrate-binding protein